tara:strand:+ start:4845 stop:5003 length:159 start_codon:yes stop_codon:yes gene_type:complete
VVFDVWCCVYKKPDEEEEDDLKREKRDCDDENLLRFELQLCLFLMKTERERK